ncbi:RNA polymerase sigma factor [Actinomadura madurae]|uniref:RNA polymerase sigma factor n=1 Tax=Actinomadura madurae TaxID=1993 RepID=UPI0020D22462|nr:sigma-70 family RNA polymerase sigma factor [Actinomadura madurae]MCP9947061.1 sigma-70 family RNA polymerase sigma factor [Actinomadura madurae]MCP9963827.1 sigma-70 family RNA polymerase sigma factor [Actinomadura madurae]MCP9976302.1 sigma-70 family RNA polymerase sigma factor [Actinomadura madurae]MCQ0012207.1 sigma-70 family RNA polymerase sigma factor [Actinomadura madurae]MCQ0012495.1 sigma-70 family RNA polymerase sigma factor [Actinomadura madurae]
MSLTHMLITGVFFTLVRALHDLCALAMAFRVAPGSTVQVTLSSRTSLHYQAAGGDTPTQHPTTIDDEDSAERTETDFIEFTRKTYEDVYKTTFAAFPGLKEDVQEVVNDVYAAIWTDWRKHSRKDAERLRRYATKAARNRTISRIRTAKSAERALDRYRRALAAPPGPDTPRADDDATLVQAVRDTLRSQLAKTPRKSHQQIITLHFTHRLTAAEIAAATGISERTVYRVIKATREELMARLGLEHPELMERIAIETRRRRRGNRPAAGKTEEEAGQ